MCIKFKQVAQTSIDHPVSRHAHGRGVTFCFTASLGEARVEKARVEKARAGAALPWFGSTLTGAARDQRWLLAQSILLAASLSTGAVLSVMDVFMASMSAAQSAAPTGRVSAAAPRSCEDQGGWRLTSIGVGEEHGGKGDHFEQRGDEAEAGQPRSASKPALPTAGRTVRPRRSTNIRYVRARVSFEPVCALSRRPLFELKVLQGSVSAGGECGGRRPTYAVVDTVAAVAGWAPGQHGMHGMACHVMSWHCKGAPWTNIKAAVPATGIKLRGR